MTEESAESTAQESDVGTTPAADADDLEALRSESEDNYGKYLRAVAELDNLRKRNARELENARKYGVERLAQALLPVRDSLEAALAIGEQADAAALLEGQRATLRLLDEALQSVGIEGIDPAGEPFDPTKHEAIGMLPSADMEPDSVVEVVQKGYSVHERVLRPARVLVARAPVEGEG